ncbi:tRNA 2-thiouridine(34) synthase MnmA [bacterium]|nr:tRNA 2-thiouridine(34) synthase MnmA [bacterium]
MKKKKVLVALSGGVDSSVSAKILQKKGHEVIGVFMDLGINDEKSKEGAKKVANFLGIELKILDIKDKFKNEIINYFIKSYEKGLTPNPCIKCNKVIKFGVLLDLLNELEADYLATGHYLQKKYHKNFFINNFFKLFSFLIKKDWKVFRSKDVLKDQTYFLYNLNQSKLDKIMFPVGKYKKNKIKKIAEKYNLPCLRKESQDICFLSGDHNIFLKKYLPLKKGEIRNLKEEVIGEHNGLYFYTIGQRRGIEIGGSGPYYVAKFDYKNNILYVVNDWDHEVLYKDNLIAENINFLSNKKNKYPLKTQAVIRYGHKAVDCEIFKGERNEDLKVKFFKKQRAVTSGQSIVFYNNRELLGGGVIK